MGLRSVFYYIIFFIFINNSIYSESFYVNNQYVHKICVNSKYFVVRGHNAEVCREVSEIANNYLVNIVSNFLPQYAEFPHKILIKIFQDHKSYVDAGNPEWSGGIYDHTPILALGPGRNIISFYEGMLERQLKDTLPHEITHCVLNEYFGGRRIPLWLNEGLAQSVESFASQNKKRKTMNDFIKKGKHLSLNKLFVVKNYPKKKEEISLFYCKSHSITRYLIEHLDKDNFKRFLSLVKDGLPMDVILKALTNDKNASVKKLQEAWLKSIINEERKTR